MLGTIETTGAFFPLSYPLFAFRPLAPPFLVRSIDVAMHDAVDRVGQT